MSLTNVILLSLALHGYIGARIVPVLPVTAAIAFVLLLAASALLVPGGLLARRLLPPPQADRLTWAGMLMMGLFSSLLVLTLLRDLLLLALHLAGGPALAEATGITVPLLALALTAVG